MTTANPIELSKLSAKTRRAIKKYGLPTCVEAFRHNNIVGEGPSNIAAMLSLPGVAQANAAINAGREIETGVSSMPKREKPHRFLYTIELHSWKPERAHEPCTDHKIIGGADDRQIAWEFAQTILRMAVNTEKTHYRVQVWRNKRRGIDEKLVWEHTRADWEKHHTVAGVQKALRDADGVKKACGAA